MSRLDNLQSVNVQEEEPPKEPSGPSSSSSSAESSPMDVREPQAQKQTRILLPAETAGAYNGDEVAGWTEHQQAKHEATLQE